MGRDKLGCLTVLLSAAESKLQMRPPGWLTEVERGNCLVALQSDMSEMMLTYLRWEHPCCLLA